MWKATVIDKIFVGGSITVTVGFTDGNHTLTEQFNTNQKQDLNWLGDQVKRKLQHLNELPKLFESIKVGEEITVSSEEAKKFAGMPPEMAEWKKNWDAFNKFIIANAADLIDEENEEFIRLHKWLKENWKNEYIEII